MHHQRGFCGNLLYATSATNAMYAMMDFNARILEQILSSSCASYPVSKQHSLFGIVVVSLRVSRNQNPAQGCIKWKVSEVFKKIFSLTMAYKMGEEGQKRELHNYSGAGHIGWNAEPVIGSLITNTQPLI